MLKKIILSLTLSALSVIGFSQTLVLMGKVIGADGQSLEGASVSLKNEASAVLLETFTNDTGEFKFVKIIKGEYLLKIEYVGFKIYTKRISIKGNEAQSVSVKLTTAQEELEAVNVYSKLNPENESSSRVSEKNANNITNVISAKAMEKSPDINAANVLQRMSGITLQKNSGADESYAIVRGLQPRYSNTLINGVKITSPDEKSRFVSLDIVPSDLLQKIEVSKTLLPEMEADAIGGTVNLVMKDAPDSMIFKAVGSIGYSNILLSRKYDNFSKNDIQQKSPYEKNGAAYTAQPADFSRSNLDFKPIAQIPTGTVGITYGKRFFKNKIGILIADNFQNQYYGTNSAFSQAVPNTYLNQPAISDIANRTFSTQQLNNGITFHLDYHINDRNKIIVNNVLLNSYLSQSRISIDTSITGGNGGRTVPGTGPVSNDYTSITNQQFLENLKVEGQHILSKHFLFDWSGVYSSATKKSPDRANLNINKKIDSVHTSNDINGPYTFVSTPYYFDGISRTWQHNEDKDYSVLGNLNYKTTWNHVFIDVKAGGLYRHKYRYNHEDDYDLKPTTNSNGVKQVFTDINTAQWIVYNPSGSNDFNANNYRAYENIAAGFGQLKISTKRVDIFGGVRMEHTEQGFDINSYVATALNHVKKTYQDLLPSVMIKYKLNHKTNIRASYFKSISRPNYYELVPYTINGGSSAIDERGNPDLKHAVAQNFDIRYEFFPKDEEQLFIGGFYKTIQNPIENAYVSSGSVITYQPQNLGDATLYGIELVYTKYFGNIGVTGNYTYIHSRISSPKFYTDVVAGTTDPHKLEDRPMQGQTNNTLNLSLLYKNEKANLFVQLAYEYLGKTLSLVYPVYGYDYYQQPQSFLALSAEKQINKHFTSFGKFNNLLNTPTENKINNLLVGKDIFKANFSLGLRYSY